MSSRLAIIRVSESEIVFVGMNDEGTAQEIFNGYTGQKITKFTCRYISQVSSVPRSRVVCVSGGSAMIGRRTFMEMCTRSETALAPQISGNMNMKPVLSRGEGGKACG